MAKRNSTKPRQKKEDAVFIRKSTAQQDIKGQEANVEKMLKAIGVYVPKTRWFSGTSSRRKVRGNEAFARLMSLVEQGKVKTVYIESQDRWGTSDRPELFSLLGLLREQGTRLYDLREKKDLTEKDLATEMMAFIGSIKSEKELQDIAYRSLRTRVANFLATGSWPTGTHPYGYGKECRTADGKLKWIFQPINRSLGKVYRPSAMSSLDIGVALD